MSTIYVEILETKGSAPRDAGTVMRVEAEGIQGTIGGGALEHEAIRAARAMLREGVAEQTRNLSLGPGLGQCCGGSVRLLFTRQHRAPAPDAFIAWTPQAVERPMPLWLWGAGHVGRALVAAAPAKAFDVTWIDDAKDRYPTKVPSHVTTLPARDMPLLAARAPAAIHHLIFTYSHEIDLALCAALLNTRAGSIGVIGSATKWARFSKRLRGMGLDPAPITCPIGDKALGKTPNAIAHGTLIALLASYQRKVPA